ncbi:MAG: Crp/Fnr family transcriptional regulator [Myxococcota bacterium]|jgi:CRP-like cAMP-binding protein
MLENPVHECHDCPLNSGGRCPFVNRRIPAGTTLWSQGDVPRELVFVKDGLVSLTSNDATGHEVLSAVRGPRALLGFEALRNQPARGAVDALTDVQVCSAEPTTVRHWVGLAEGAASPPTRDVSASATTLLNLALDELDRTARDIDLRSGPALSRVARFLLASSKLIDAGRQAPFSKQHVAQLLGIRAETMSRCLKKLQTAGLIESGRTVKIRDTERLAEVARGQT